MASDSMEEVFLYATGVFSTSNGFYRVVQDVDQYKKQNLIFSPYSISSCFAVLRLGARGSTAQELDKAFHYPPNEKTLCQGLKNIFQSHQALIKPTGPSKANDAAPVVLLSANRLYLDKRVTLLGPFEKALVDSLGNGVVLKVDLKPSVAGEINGWVEKVTEKKIRNVIRPDDLSASPSMVLINAVYFKGLWEHKFDPAMTQEADFFLSDREGDSAKVQMMKSKAGIQIPTTFLDNLDADVFALPYKGERFAFLVFLPKTRSGLDNLEKNLTKLSAPLKEVIEMKKSSCQIFLPKFQVESDFNLTQILPKLGVTTIFSAGGDLSGMTSDGKSLSVSKAIHKAFIAVDEEGAEAAAVTAVMMSRSVPPPPRVLRVDHPFYFEVVDKMLHLVVFSGAYRNPPTASSSKSK